MKDQIHHVAIPTNNVAESVAWYTSHTNCTVQYQDETWALLDYQNIQLALVLPGQHPPHLAIIRDNAGDFGPLVTHRDGTRSIYVQDNAGNQLEIMEAESIN
jgi:catechol 2,3-dioxygenase-like lactoylglutathione lyase family enzyme